MWIRRLFFIFIYISGLFLTLNLFKGVCYADIIPVAEPTRYTQPQTQSAPAIIKAPTIQTQTISKPTVQQPTIQQPVKPQPQVQQQAPVNEVIPVAPKITLKINSINFDNSDSIIFLGTSAPDDFNNIRITKKVLSEPDRIFFDIENAIITFPNSTFELKNSRLTKVRIAQNSVEPKIVRLVIWNSENYDATNIKLLKIKNNLIIKLSNEIPLQKYLTQIYKESKESSVEYNDNVTVIQEEKQITETPSTTESDEIFDKVQQAFKEDNQQLVRPNIEQKQARLKSRFFLEKIVPKSGNLLLSGIGVINVQKPFILTEPSRIVFDLPNTIVLQELRDKEIKLSETETAKIGQFSPSVARIVIKTANPDFYRPVYSTNLQTLLIANKNKMLGLDFSDNYSELSYFKEQNINPSIDIINMMFSKPIVYSIQREQNYLNVIFYNLFKFDVAKFNSLSMANKTGFIAKQLSTNIYKFSFPVKSTELVDCYETLNTSQLRFVFTKQQQTTNNQSSSSTIKEPVRKPDSFTDLIVTPQIKKEKPEKKPKQENLVSTKIKNKRIVIDAGHGGNDTGAIKNKIYEKDLTLEIAQRVRDILKVRGLKKVFMTRDEDKTLSLADRVDFANNKNADIYVSIHINASVKTEINGIETHYYTENGYNVAKIMHKELMENVEAEDRGLFKSKFYVINHTEAPAVLLELGFISNDQERNALTSTKRQEDSANAIAEGIINYLMEYEKD